MVEMVVKRGLAPAADKSGTATADRTSGDSPRFVCLAPGACPLLYGGIFLHHDLLPNSGDAPIPWDDDVSRLTAHLHFGCIPKQ